MMKNIAIYLLLMPMFLFLSCDGINTPDYNELTYAWTKTFGGSGDDFAYALATDASGSVYTAGAFSDTVDFDPGADIEIHTSSGETDCFLTKMKRGA